MQYRYQMNFWFTSCDAVLQFSCQDIVVLHSTKLVPAYCYQSRIHRRIICNSGKLTSKSDSIGLDST